MQFFFLEHVCVCVCVCVLARACGVICHNILLNNENVCYLLHTNTPDIVKGTKVINILKYEVSYWNSISNIQIQTELPCQVTQKMYPSITLQGNTDHLHLNYPAR